MKIFISWSGETSKALAEVLKKWLPTVIQAVKPYYSADDVSKGTRWNNEIAKELEEAKIGLICLTRDNLEAPWILFEAGALSKTFDKSKVCPILFGVDATDIKGPLVQFQSARFEKSEMKKVIQMINKELGKEALPPEVLEDVFATFWPKLEEKTKTILKQFENSEPSSLRTERDMLEEILTLSRTLNIRVPGRTKRERIDPGAIRHLIESFGRLSKDVIKQELVVEFYPHLQELNRPIGYLIEKASVPVVERTRWQRIFQAHVDELEAFMSNARGAE